MSETSQTDGVPARSGLRRLPRNVWVLTAVSFLTDLSSEMVVHLLPLFLANVLGARTLTIGLIEGVAETTSSLVKLLSGRYSDRLGQRKWLTVAGYALSTIAKPFLALANSWTAVLAVRFVERTGKGIRTAPRDALIADSIDAKQRGLAFGLHRAGDTAGAVLGLLVAMLVIWQWQGSTPTLTRATFNTLVWLSLIPATLAVILLVAGVREGTGSQTAKTEPSRITWEALGRPFHRFLFIMLLFTLGNSADAFLILRAQATGLALLPILGLLLLFNLVYTIVSGPIGSLSDRWGRRRVLLAGWLLYAMVYLGFALAQQSWHLVLLFVAYGVYYGFAEGIAKAFVADLVQKDQRGTAYGWFNGTIGLAALPASLIAGLLWQGAGSWTGFGMAAPFLFGGVLALTAALLLWRWLPDTAVL
ncbi:MAG TPA: MFS transporter [Chloroflexota bacterium]|nr:MFS transporter [Chloroflexota bacterium]